jgi:hypothetical protein
MKAKSLLLAGAVVFASAAGAMAQGTVFSVNAVGFVNKTFQAQQFTLAANPLVAADNSLNALFASAPDGTQIFKFNPATQSFQSAVKFATIGFLPSGINLVPGEAAYVKNNSASDFTITFVGNVNQGSLTNSLVPGFNMVSSQVPQAGGIQTDLGYQPGASDQVFKFSAGAFSSFLYLTSGNGLWLPSEPHIAVGEGVFVKRNLAGNWTRTFSVNQ